MKNFDVDIVITWVDQKDPNWMKKYRKFVLGRSSEEEIRFRDYGTLKYVLRSIEVYAPWVRNVYLITDNQVPDWINKENSKLKIIFHNEIIEGKYLPTFNSNVIDLNLCNIQGLSEHFIYFNDDMFLNDFTKKEDFFSKKGFPKDTYGTNVIMPNGDFDHIYVNNIAILNKKFNKRKYVRRNLDKVYNIKNGPWAILSLVLSIFPKFTRFYDPHTPISFLKSNIYQILNEFPEIKGTYKYKTRSKSDYSIWLMRYWQMLSGNFSVRKFNFGKHYVLSDIKNIKKEINCGTHKVININDSDDLNIEEFTKITEELKFEFSKKFPNKSLFEKGKRNEES